MFHRIPGLPLRQSGWREYWDGRFASASAARWRFECQVGQVGHVRRQSLGLMVAMPRPSALTCLQVTNLIEADPLAR